MSQEQKIDIDDKDLMLRRIHNACFRDDDTMNEYAFIPNDNDNDGFSVHVKRLYAKPLKKYNHGKMFKTVEFIAEIPRRFNYDVMHDPYPTNLAHALIVGDMEKMKKDEEYLGAMSIEASIAFDPIS